jgi:Putative lumazine-binding
MPLEPGTSLFHSPKEIRMNNLHNPDNPFSAVSGALQDYFDGLYESNTEKLARVFHPLAIYACATETPFLYRTMPEYFPIVDRRPSPASRGEPRRDRILSIAFAGPNTAIVEAECAIGPKRFTDLLTMVRVDERWQIIAKVFHYELHN